MSRRRSAMKLNGSRSQRLSSAYMARGARKSSTSACSRNAQITLVPKDFIALDASKGESPSMIIGLTSRYNHSARA